MSNTCSIDRTFGQFGTLWSEMPTPLHLPSGAPELNPEFVGGYLNSVWSVGPSNRPALLVSSWDPHLFLSGSLNWRVLRLVLFPADGHPDGLARGDGTYHFFLSSLGVHCEYLDSDDNGSNLFLVVVRETAGQPGPWAYILRQVSIVDGSVPSVQKTDFPLLPGWLYEPSDTPPFGNLKIQVDRSNPTRAALVSTKAGALRIGLLLLGQMASVTTTDFLSLSTGLLNPWVRLRVESVYFYGGDLSVALTGWRSSGSTQGLIFRLKVTGATVTRNPAYGTDGLWESSLSYPSFRAVRECSNALVGIDGHKLVVMGVQPDGQDLDPGFGVGGIGEFDLGGTLLDPASAGEDRNGWIHFFAQRQSDLATVGARVRVNTPLNPVPNGTLDPAFGTNGLVTLKVDGYSTAPGGFTLHDGTVLDVGLFRAINAADTIRVSGVARLKLLDASLDSTFGSAGVARHGGSSPASAFRADGSRVHALTRESNLTTVVWLDAAGKFERALPFPPPVPPVPDSVMPYLRVRSVLIHTDGSIWVSGVGSSAWVVRITAAGNLDQTFGTGGVVKLRENDGPWGTTELIGWRPGGGVIAKVMTNSGIFLCGVTSGGLDQNFGQGGYTPLGVHEYGYLIRPDGSVVFPTTDGPTILFPWFGLTRITSTGAIDPNFGMGNLPATAPLSRHIVLNVPYPGSSISVLSFAIAGIVERGGKIYAIGTAGCGQAPTSGRPNPPRYDFILITRWNQDGTLDTNYGSSGAAFHGLDSSGDYLDWSCDAVAAEPGQPITLAGNAKGNLAIWQLTDSGLLDTGFGSAGVCSVVLQEVEEDTGFAIAMLPGGKARISCSTGLVQFVITSLPSKSIPQKILEAILNLFAAVISVFSKTLSERIKSIKV